MNKEKYNQIKKVFEEKVISKIKRGLYHWDDNNVSANEELISVSKIVPKGVFCLLSALSYYEITTISPWQYYTAIFRDDRKPVLPDYPPINIFHFSKEQYETGIKEVKIDNHKIKIYDIEKTICDCLRYRNEIGTVVI